MNWTLTISVIVVIVAIITLYVMIRQSKKKRPTWAFTTRQVIGRDAESPPELKYVFGDQEVEEVYVTTIIFFNRGDENYYGDLVTTGNRDINEPIIIDFGGAQILRQPTIKIQSKGVANKFGAETIEINGEQCIQLHFPMLSLNDGALIEVWHTKCKLKPDITNANIHLLNDFIREPPKNIKRYIATSSVFILGLMAILVYGLVSSKDAGTRVVISILFGGFALFIITDMLKALRFMVFPSWSRLNRKAKTQ